MLDRASLEKAGFVSTKGPIFPGYSLDDAAQDMRNMYQLLDVAIETLVAVPRTSISAGDLARVDSLVWISREMAEQAAERLELDASPTPARADPAPFVETSELSSQEALALADALSTLNEVVAGLQCQPRFTNDDGLNGAGQILDRLGDTIARHRDAAVDRLAAATPAANEWKFERLARICALLRFKGWELDRAEDIVGLLQQLLSGDSAGENVAAPAEASHG